MYRMQARLGFCLELEKRSWGRWEGGDKSWIERRDGVEI